jgi:hypothetical protein
MNQMPVLTTDELAAATLRTFNTGLAWREWLNYVLGTNQWVVAKRASQHLTNKGYAVCFTPKTYAALEAGYQAQADSEFGPWHIASGYRTESGRSMWRICRDRKDNPARFETLTGPNGRMVLIESFEAARKRAVKENCAP